MERRQFLKVAAAGTALAATGCSSNPSNVDASGHVMPKGALGLLYDSTICIGCKACVASCKEANNMPPEFNTEDKLWDTPKDLSSKTRNIIKVFKVGKGLTKDVEDDGHAFIKRQCMHCVDPSCASACPASALVKNPENGVVEYKKENCIGCRYCMVACPYEIPKFEWDKALPVIVKCELCNHRYKDNKIAGCAEACPTGATLFGKTEDLLKEAKKRLEQKPGTVYDYPLNTVTSGVFGSRPTVGYKPAIYGEKEVGGAQCLILSAVDHAKLGLPTLPTGSYARLSEKVQHTIYKGMIAPLTAFLLLLGLAYKGTKSSEDGDKHE